MAWIFLQCFSALGVDTQAAEARKSFFQIPVRNFFIC